MNFMLWINLTKERVTYFPSLWEEKQIALQWTLQDKDTENYPWYLDLKKE